MRAINNSMLINVRRRRPRMRDDLTDNPKSRHDTWNTHVIALSRSRPVTHVDHVDEIFYLVLIVFPLVIHHNQLPRFPPVDFQNSKTRLGVVGSY